MKPDGAAVRSLSWGQLLRLSALWFGLQFFWTIHQLAVLPERIRHFVDVSHLGSRLGLVESCGAVVVLLTQFCVGFLSDHAQSRLGRRRPFILFGIACGCGAIILFMLAPSYWPLFAAYMLIQFFLNVGTLPFQSLLPDLVPEAQHARAGSAMGLMDLAGRLLALLTLLASSLLVAGTVVLTFIAPMSAASGGSTFFGFGAFHYEVPRSYLVVLLPAYLIALLGSLLLVYFGADELHWARHDAARAGADLRTAAGAALARLRVLPGVLVEYRAAAGGLFPSILQTYLGIDLRARPDFVWLAASRSAVYLGYFTFVNYVSWYTQKDLDRAGWLRSLGLSAASAAKHQYQDSVLAAMLIFFILGGILGNLLCAPLARRFGKKWVISAGLTLAITLFIPLLFTSSVWVAVGCGFVLGSGWGAFLAADWAFACTLMPAERAGVFMGLWCLTNLMPQVFAPVLAGPLRDTLFAHYSLALSSDAAEAQTYRWVFATVILYFALGLLLIRRVKEARMAAAGSGG